MLKTLQHKYHHYFCSRLEVAGENEYLSTFLMKIKTYSKEQKCISNIALGKFAAGVYRFDTTYEEISLSDYNVLSKYMRTL